MRIAIIADWLPVYAGAEHVIAEFRRLWPDAPIFTSVANHGRLGPLDESDIQTSSLQKWYKLSGRHHRILLPLMPKAMEEFDLGGFDVILSSSHAVGKGIIPPSAAKHICYCHTPMRYGWEMENEYLKNSRIPKIFWKRIKKTFKQIRRWDMTTAKRVDVFIANSTSVADRIKKIYNRDSVVIHPPVSDRFFAQKTNPTALLRYCAKKEYLALGRLVPYKRFDLLIETANRFQIFLKIAGEGPDEGRLRRMAGPTVSFTGFVNENDLIKTYSNAKALLYPQEEDAGIAPLEAQACGTPVIAFGKGGALDTIGENQTGIFFHEQTSQALKEAIDRFEAMQFNRDAIIKHAEKFSAEKFREKILDIIKNCLPAAAPSFSEEQRLEN